jgi:hypothetical protein
MLSSVPDCYPPVLQITYGFPLPSSVVADLDKIRAHVKVIIFLDHEEQVALLESFEGQKPESERRPWHAFLKADSGGS